MPRIRSVKPEFWDSPSTARASLRARLFYIAMWNWADDWGVGDANPRRLLGFAFPNDESSEVEPRNFRRLASEVADCFGVTWYEVDGRPYYAIPTWEAHQRTEKKARRAFPAPEQAERILYDAVSEVPTPNRGSSDEGAGEQGKGEQGKGEAATRGAAAPPADDPSAELDQPTAATLVAEWIDHCDARPPSRVIGQLSKEIKTLLTEGTPYPEVRDAVATWHAKGLHPSTLASVVHENRATKKPTRATGTTRALTTLEIAARYEEQEGAGNAAQPGRQIAG